MSTNDETIRPESKERFTGKIDDPAEGARDETSDLVDKISGRIRPIKNEIHLHEPEGEPEDEREDEDSSTPDDIAESA